MSHILPKAPDNSAQIAALNKEQAQAKAQAAAEQQKRAQQILSLRRRQMGRDSLIRNTGGALGVEDTLGPSS